MAMFNSYVKLPEGILCCPKCWQAANWQWAKPVLESRVAHRTPATSLGPEVMEMLKQCRKNAMRLGEEALAADQDAGTMDKKWSKDFTYIVTCIEFDNDLYIYIQLIIYYYCCYYYIFIYCVFLYLSNYIQCIFKKKKTSLPPLDPP